MPAVGIDSINLSSSDVAALADFFATGFFRGFLIVGFFVVFVEGVFIVGFFDGFARGIELLEGAGITFVDFSPLPRRPSMTMWPSWV